MVIAMIKAHKASSRVAGNLSEISVSAGLPKINEFPVKQILYSFLRIVNCTP